MDGQYIELAKELDGQVIKFGQRGDAHINPFDICHDFGDEADLLTDNIDVIIAIIESLLKIVGANEKSREVRKSILNNCIRRCYKTDSPMFQTLYSELINIPKTVDTHVSRQELIQAVEYILNSDTDMLAHKTDVNHGKRLIIYDLREYEWITVE